MTSRLPLRFTKDTNWSRTQGDGKLSLTLQAELSKKDYGIACLLAVLTWLLFRPFVLFNVDPLHDGYIFKPAMDIASGQLLYRDTTSGYGYLSFLFHEVALRFYGMTVKGLKLGVLAFYPVCAAFFYLAWRSCLPRAHSVFSVFLWWLQAPIYYFVGVWGGHFQPWTSVHAMAFQAISMAAYTAALADSKHRQVWFLVTGAASALAIWSREPVGLLLTMALILALAIPGLLRKQSWLLKAIPVLLCGQVIVHAAIAASLAAQGTLGAWFEQVPLGNWRWFQAQPAGGNAIQHGSAACSSRTLGELNSSLSGRYSSCRSSCWPS